MNEAEARHCTSTSLEPGKAGWRVMARKTIQKGDVESDFQQACKIVFRNKRETASRAKWVRAIAIWRKCALQKHPGAEFYLGTCYEFAKGVRRNLRVAIKWYLVAARHGHPDAQFNVGFSYLEGNGLEGNDRRAVRWLRMAARQGNYDAQRDLGYCYIMGIGTKQDYKKGVLWYKRAALRGDAKSQWNLALCFKDGTGVKKNTRTMEYWLRRGSQGGHLRARRLLRKINRGKLGRVKK